MKKIKNTVICIVLFLGLFSNADSVNGQKGTICSNSNNPGGVLWTVERDLTHECRYNIEVTNIFGYQNWSSSIGNAMPHGIYINVAGGYIDDVVSFQSAPTGWFINPTPAIQVPASITSNLQTIFWIKQVHCGGLTPSAPETKINAIPDNETLKLSLDIIPDPSVLQVYITVAYVLGGAWPYYDQIPVYPGQPVKCNIPTNLPQPPSQVVDLDCIEYYSFPRTQFEIICNYGDDYHPPTPNPIPDCKLCLPAHKSAVLTISPDFLTEYQNNPLLPPTTVIWYKCTTCPIPCANVTMADLPQNGGGWVEEIPQTTLDGNPQIFFATGILENTTCYVAFIERGCESWLTDPVTIWVCKSPPSINIASNPPLTYINVTWDPAINPPHWNKGWHACSPWSGTLSISDQGLTCLTNILWEEWDYTAASPNWITIQNLTYPPANPVDNPLESPLLSLAYDPSFPGCDQEFKYRLTLDNGCDPIGQQELKIHVDKPTEDCPYSFFADPEWIGTVTGTTILNPIFCDRGATVIKLNSECLMIKQWEICELSDPCTGTWGTWTVLNEAGSSPTWWTNILDKSTKYRVWLYNAACLDVNNPFYSTELEVTIVQKPLLTLTTDGYVCSTCPWPTLTATINCPLVNPVTSYEWSLNGTLVATTYPPYNTYETNLSGSWTVTALGGICGPVTSDKIFLCGSPVLTIDGACGLCEGETITLIASVSGCDIQTIIYEWKDGSGASLSADPSIDISIPDTYSVTVLIDGCCQLTAQVIIVECPSTFH